MYAIDINFLNDREAPELEGTAQSVSIPDSQFMIYGGVVAVLALIGAGVFYFITNNTLEAKQTEKRQLEAQKSEIERKAKEAQELEQQINAVQTQTQTLTTLFVGKLPAYAILSDLRRRTPDTVQIQDYGQTDSADASVVQIRGVAKDYDAMNDFLLLLQASPFFDPSRTKLQTASRAGGTDTEVNFTINAELTKDRADKLKQPLADAGAQGLLVRINKLIERGVIGAPAN